MIALLLLMFCTALELPPEPIRAPRPAVLEMPAWRKREPWRMKR